MKICIFLSICVFCFSFLIPNHYYPWLTVYQDAASFLSLLLLFFSLLAQQKISILITPLILFFLLPLVQFLLGNIYFWGDAFIVSVYILGFILSTMLGYNIGKNFNDKVLYLFSIALIISSIVSIFFALKQWLLLTKGGIWIVDLPLNGRPFANFAQPNNLATFLCMGLIAVLYLYEKNYFQKFSGVLLASFVILGIALTQSRTPWVFSFAFVIWWFWKKRYFNMRIKTRQLFTFIGLYVICIVILPDFSSFLGVTSTADAITRATTGYLRIPMWHQMLLAIKNEPLWGYGWNQVSVAQLIIYPDYPTTEWIEHSHNILLDLLVWNGVPVGIFIIGFLTWWLYQLSKLANSLEPFVALAMVGVVLVHAMLEYPLEYAFFLLPIGFLLGFVQTKEKNIKIITISRNEFSAFLGFFVGIFIWIFVEYRMIEKDVQLVRFESLNIGKIHADHAAPNIVLLTQLREQIRFIRTPPMANMSQEQLDWMRQVAYRYATSAALYRYAQALALNNYPELAKKHLLIIEKLHGKKFSFESLYQVNHSLAFEWQNVSASKP